MTEIRNVSNIVAFGAEWATENGTRYQLVAVRGGYEMTFGCLPNGEHRWIHHGAVTRPERFGSFPVKSAAEFMAIADRFVSTP
jgi:hypothetical protein